MYTRRAAFTLNSEITYPDLSNPFAGEGKHTEVSSYSIYDRYFIGFSYHFLLSTSVPKPREDIHVSWRQISQASRVVRFPLEKKKLSDLSVKKNEANPLHPLKV